MFIVFEGIDGSGKSTQVELLQKALTQQGIKNIRTREPGGCPSAEHIRNLILQHEFLPVSELLLMVAARYEHWHHTIQPALARKEWVICDRYIDSTRAYQGFQAGIDLSLIDQLHNMFQIPIQPDLVFILMLDIDAALDRARSRGQQNRFDHFDKSYYEKLYDGFHALASTSDHYHIVDAHQSVEAIHQHIMAIINLYP